MLLWGFGRLSGACTGSDTAWEEPGLEGDKLLVLPPSVASSHVHREEGPSPVTAALTASDPLSPCLGAEFEAMAVVAKKIVEKTIVGT